MHKLVLTLFFVLPLTVLAQDHSHTDIPGLILSGVEAYKPASPEDAIKAWTRNSSLDPAALTANLAPTFHQAQNLYGRFQGFDVISNRAPTDRLRIIYLTLNYDRGPLYARFVLYRAAGEWVLTALDVSLDDTHIVPPADE